MLYQTRKWPGNLLPVPPLVRVGEQFENSKLSWERSGGERNNIFDTENLVIFTLLDKVIKFWEVQFFLGKSLPSKNLDIVGADHESKWKTGKSDKSVRILLKTG